MGTDELDELLGLKPRFDMPAAERRSMSEVGVISQDEGGLPAQSLAKQPAALVRATLKGLDGPVVSRWGHIMLRRALASRLNTPDGMAPADFAAARIAALNAMGEFRVGRAMAQDVDAANWNTAMADAGIASYVGTMDMVGACPVLMTSGADREDLQSELLKNICFAYSGQEGRARANLRSALRKGDAAEIDLRLTQRFAGAAGEGGRAVNIEWEDVDKLTPWRFAMATALGIELPEKFTDDLGAYYQRSLATAPMVPIGARLPYADRAAREGILSSAAMVDLYSVLHTRQSGGDKALVGRAATLRKAYVATDQKARIAAMRELWGGTTPDYAGLVLTAYAAARIQPTDQVPDDTEQLISSMLTAGLDRDALLWAEVVPQGSRAWAQLVLAAPRRENPVSGGQFDSFWGNDQSEGNRRTKFLLAGLAGLGRMSQEDVTDIAEDLELDLARQTKWSQTIARAADYGNPALVAFLAGLGMRGDDWSQMTPLHLYHIVSSLNRVGLSAEARMIAAEAVARG